jgi:cytosine/adenosine deaminase-related metal-dependent hydrolase
MRFHAARGSMSVGQSQGGLPPDRVVEDEAAILKDTQRLIERWHDPRRFAMQRIVVAPCSPFSVSRDLMRESALLARSFGDSYGVSLHTHLAENDNDIAYTREKFGCTPAEYAEQLGWVGRDVWCAHCVKLDAAGIALFAKTGTGVAHCPCSNMRLASGIAPVRAMRDAGVSVALGVDGAASNDAGHLLGEARMALLLQRVATACPPVAGYDDRARAGVAGGPGSGPAPGPRGRVNDPSAMGAREVLEIATLGGAKVLNRDDIGALAPGMAADIVTWPLDGIATAGALHDPLAALVFCQVPKVRHSIVNGRVIVRDGEITTLDLPRLAERHNLLAARLLQAARAT